MAISSMQRPPLRHFSSFVSSGTLIIPDGVTRVYATVEGATGISYNQYAPSGQTHRASGYVEVIPGKTATVTIGAGSVTNAGRAGTTSFDGAVTVIGSVSGYAAPEGSRYSGGGASGSVTTTTSLPSQAPAGAVARVTGSTFVTFYPGSQSSGVVHIYG